MFTIFPFFWIVITSFKLTKDIMTNEIFSKPTLKNYLVIFAPRSPFPRYLLNSFVTAVVSTLLSIFTGVLASYSLSRFRYAIRVDTYILAFLLFTRMIFPVALAIPFYALMQMLGLYDTVLALILVNTAVNVPFAIWMLKAFFDEFPENIEDAAKVDGCSTLGVLVKIALPLIKPGIAAAAIFVFMLSWNDYLFAATLTTSPRAMTLPIGLANFIQENIVQWGPMSAGAALFTVPIFLFASLVQEHLIKGFSLGSFKG
ncbi:MAG: carbohydrate ABC transporter permease [Firmicutes bacterium]|nr:carbohydrate ABC transporter permease [Bacillota bacterium]